jgi:hypothetical protein
MNGNFKVLQFRHKRVTHLTVAVLVAAVSVCPASATSVIVDFTENRIIIAADSRGIERGSGRATPRNDVCKLTVLGGEFVFVEAGFLNYKPPLGPVPEWEANSDAIKAYKMAGHDLLAAAQNWSVSESDHFKRLFLAHPQIVKEVASHQNGVLVWGVFAGKSSDGSLVVYLVTVRFDDPLSAILSLTSEDPIKNRVAKVKPPKVFTQNAVTQELFAGQTDRAKQSIEEWQRKATKILEADREVRRLEFIVAETGKLDPANVGGPTNTVSISRQGVTWLSNQTCK